MWSSNLSSVMAQRFRELVIPLITLALTKSPLVTGLVVLSQQLGTLLLAIPAGTWIEGKNKLRVVLISKMLSAAFLFIMAYLLFINQINSILIAFLLFMVGVCGLLSRTAFNVMIPRVTGRENLVNAHTSLEAADAISTLLGPVLAGVILAKLGSSTTLFFCGVLMVISMLFLIRMNYSENKREANTNDKDMKKKLQSFWETSLEGVKYLYNNHSQKVCTISICILSFSTTYVVLTVVIHAQKTLELDPGRIGILMSFAGVGNILGVILHRWVQRVSWIRVLSILLLISGIGVMLIGISSNYWVACFGMMLFDGCLSMAFIVQVSVHQGITPDSALSRVKSSTYVIGGVFGVLGTFLSGAIPQFFSTGFALLMGGLILTIPAAFIISNNDNVTKMNQVKPLEFK